MTIRAYLNPQTTTIQQSVNKYIPSLDSFTFAFLLGDLLQILNIQSQKPQNVNASHNTINTYEKSTQITKPKSPTLNPTPQIDKPKTQQPDQTETSHINPKQNNVATLNKQTFSQAKTQPNVTEAENKPITAILDVSNYNQTPITISNNEQPTETLITPNTSFPTQQPQLDTQPLMNPSENLNHITEEMQQPLPQTTEQTKPAQPISQSGFGIFKEISIKPESSDPQLNTNSTLQQNNQTDPFQLPHINPAHSLAIHTNTPSDGAENIDTQLDIQRNNTTQQPATNPLFAQLVTQKNKLSSQLNENSQSSPQDSTNLSTIKTLNSSFVQKIEIVNQNLSNNNSGSSLNYQASQSNANAINSKNLPSSNETIKYTYNFTSKFSRRLASQSRQQMMIERISKLMKMAAQKNMSRVKIELDPPNIGTLKLELKVRKGSVSANLHTENAAAKHFLLNNLHMLKQALENQGMTLSNFNVFVSQDTQDNNQSLPQHNTDNSLYGILDSSVNDISTDVLTQRLSYYKLSGLATIDMFA